MGVLPDHRPPVTYGSNKDQSSDTEADPGPADKERKATGMGGPGGGRWVEKTDEGLDTHLEEAQVKRWFCLLEFITK